VVFPYCPPGFLHCSIAVLFSFFCCCPRDVFFFPLTFYSRGVMPGRTSYCHISVRGPLYQKPCFSRAFAGFCFFSLWVIFLPETAGWPFFPPMYCFLGGQCFYPHRRCTWLFFVCFPLSYIFLPLPHQKVKVFFFFFFHGFHGACLLCPGFFFFRLGVACLWSRRRSRF